jgi:hypothetical protein
MVPSGHRSPEEAACEHTDEVLASVGYSTEQIATLRRSGAVA